MTHELEVQYLRFILERMKSNGEGNRLLVNTERVYLAKTNLILLEACLASVGDRGVFVAIDRPYHYMAHLLRIHKISHDNIMFIDAITNISGERKVEGDAVNFLDTPFAIHKILRDLKISRNGPHGVAEEIDLLDRDFLLMDDLSTIFYYGSVASRKRLLRDYLTAFEGRENTFTAVVVDREAHRELYEFLSQFVDRGVDMGTASFEVAEAEGPEDAEDAAETAKPPGVRG